MKKTVEPEKPKRPRGRPRTIKDSDRPLMTGLMGRPKPVDKKKK